MFGGATLVIAALFVVARFVSLVNDFLHVLVALVFLYTPVVIARRNGTDLVEYGFTLGPVKKGLGLTALCLLLVFPLFAVGFVLYYQLGCGTSELLFPTGVCRRFVGWEGLTDPQPPRQVMSAAFAQVVVIALPEELFFRGYMLHRLEQVWKPRWRVLGGGLGLALVVSSLLFAVSHVVVDMTPARAAVFFPGLLFGWLRSATGSILAPTIVHAASNLYVESLFRTFIR